MAHVVEIGKQDVFTTGRSSSKTFKDGYFDYNFNKFLGLATYSGAEIAECFETAARIEDGNVESWIEAWTSTARRVEAYAERVSAGGHKVSAREAWLRATTYYQAAFFFCLYDDPRKAQLYQKHTNCFQSAGKLFTPPLEVVAIPYEGKSLFGYFLRPHGEVKPRPTVLIQMGADGSSEQIYFSGGGAAALRRGYNALIFEGPGQTGTFMRDPSLTYRYDWEVPVKAVVDFALTKKEVDPERIALVAYSMGGYLGPRAAAFEKRLAAIVTSGLVPSMIELAGDRLTALRKMRDSGNTNYNHAHKYAIHEHMPKYGLNNGIDDLEALTAHWQKFNLEGLEDKITCPMLVVQAAAEGEHQTRLAREFFAKLSNPRNTFRLTTEDDAAEMHCQKGNAMLLHAIEFDWLDDVLGLTGAAATNGTA